MHADRADFDENIDDLLNVEDEEKEFFDKSINKDF